MLSLKDQFIAFCRSKPADEGYDFDDVSRCACGQFFDFMGLDWGGNAFDLRMKMERDYGQILLAEPTSFGALASRLEKAA